MRTSVFFLAATAAVEIIIGLKGNNARAADLMGGMCVDFFLQGKMNGSV